MSHELVVNLHMHTTYSDGSGSHADIVQAALKTGIDVAIVTDHNVLVNGPEDIYRDGDRKMLLLVGEEIHDQSRDPQKNHLLVFGASRELATLAPEPQRLIDGIAQADGVSFLAHPFELDGPAIHEKDIAWVDWEVQGYTGLELWNAMSEFKGLLKTWLHALYYAYNPRRAIFGPYATALRKWDELLAAGRRVVAIGGTDAHALKVSLGPLRRTVFPYEFHFTTINTHVLVPQALSDDAVEGRRMVLTALRQGHAFIGYDLPAATRGFRFIAQGMDTTAMMGDEISGRNGVTFQIRLPQVAECHLLKDGKPLKTWRKSESCTYIATEAGVYRVEVYLPYLGQRRGWIFSNPIYVR